MKKMKKALVVFGLVAGMLATTACGSGQPTDKTATVKPAKEYPQWVLNPAVEGGVGAIGISTIGPAGIQFARTDALANARDEIARVLQLKVQNMVKNFTQQIGVGDQATVDKVSLQVSKQVANASLQGAEQKAMWIDPDTQDIYVWVVMGKEVIKEETKSAVKSSMGNKNALWQQFQAKNGFDSLDGEIDKMENTEGKM